MKKLTFTMMMVALCFGTQADVLTYSYTGTIYQVNDLSPSGIQVGDTVTGTVTFADSPVPGANIGTGSNSYFYNQAIQAISISVGGFTGFLGPTFQGDNYIAVTDALVPDSLFADTVVIFSPLASNEVNNQFLGRVNFQFVYPTDNLSIDGPDIPTIDLADFDEVPYMQIITWSDPNFGPSFLHSASIDTFELIDVQPDTDDDGAMDSADNCILVANFNQRDTDSDGYGNACDGDFNNDCAVNFIDLSLFANAFLSADPLFDLNSDAQINFVDLSILSGLFFMQPGPSGTTQTCD